MTERAFGSEGRMIEAAEQSEKDRLLQRVVELEKELMKMKRTEKVLRDMERRGRPPAEPGAYALQTYALQALNSCPGLLCFAVDKNGVLLHSTRGYREIARRFFGHECAVGLPYPASVSTAFDADLQDLIQEAFRGGTAAASLEETSGNMSRWTVTGAPLLSAAGAVTGAIVSLTPVHQHGESAPPPDVSGLRQAGFPDSLDSIPGMFFVVDDDACCIEANAHFLSLMKLPREAVLGRLFGEFLLESDDPDENTAADLSRVLEMDCKVSAGDGDILSLSLKGTRIQWKGEPRTLVCCADNTKLRRAEEQLKRVSVTDASTGILNRQGMERVLNAEIERTARYRGSLSMIMLDIDGFRGLNERIGYSASDKVLKDLAAAVKQRIRLTDFLGRWGGDEFMVLTPMPLEPAAQLAEKLRDMAEHMQFTDAHQGRFTLSAGVAGFRRSMDVSSFVGAAYDAMIEAKRNGGNRVERAKELEPPSGGV